MKNLTYLFMLLVLLILGVAAYANPSTLLNANLKVLGTEEGFTPEPLWSYGESTQTTDGPEWSYGESVNREENE